MSVTEMAGYGYIIVCIYRSPDSNFCIVLKNLELIMQEIQSRNKKLLLCGEWNLNFMLDNIRLQELQNLLESYDKINTVRSLRRITPSTEFLIDIIITNKDNPELRASVVDLGFSDHLAPIVRTNIGKGSKRTKIIVRRQLTNTSIEELKNLLSKESWNEVFNHSDVNSSLKAFLGIFLYCFDIAFPCKGLKLREIIKKGGFQRD